MAKELKEQDPTWLITLYILAQGLEKHIGCMYVPQIPTGWTKKELQHDLSYWEGLSPSSVSLSYEHMCLWQIKKNNFSANNTKIICLLHCFDIWTD